MSFLRYLSISLILFLVVSCEVRIPDNVIPPDKMEAILYDYHLVQAMSGEYGSDAYKEKLFYTYIFKKHNVEKAYFDSTMQWYNRYPKHLRKVYENISARIDAEVEELNLIKVIDKEGVTIGQVSFTGDNTDLWTSSKTKYLSSNSLNNRLSFSFDVPDDTTFVKGDSLVFSFRTEFVSCDSVTQDAFASIRLDYDDKSFYAKSVEIDSAGGYCIAAPRYHESKLKSMYGFVYYTDNDTTACSRMLLHDVSLMRIHPSTSEEN